MMRDVATRLVNRFGYEIISRWRLDHFEQTKYLRRLFDYFQIDCVLDVGANVGQYRDYLRYEVGFVGPIVSFEPIPRNLETLKARAVHDSRWIIKEVALGASPETKTFNVMRHNSLEVDCHMVASDRCRRGDGSHKKEPQVA